MSREIKIAGYSALEEIGQGGMGKVYRAVQDGVKRTVALKTLEQSLLLDNDSAKRMVREARISGKLLHENIVKIHDAGESGGTYFISMELLPGGDLSARVKQGLKPYKAIEYALVLADALGFAHQQGFVHRDIKPDNIMLREDGTPVITDFGIARPIDSRTHLTITGAIIGTPQFMSPEQTKGLPVDGRSDLYSLASVLFYLLTGEALFKADSVLALTYQQVHHPIPNLLAPYHKLQWFFDKALAKEPEERYQSGVEMKTALEKLHTQCLKMPQLKVPFERVSPSPAVKQGKNTRVIFGLSFALVLLVAGAWVGYKFNYQKPDIVADTDSFEAVRAYEDIAREDKTRAKEPSGEKSAEVTIERDTSEIVISDIEGAQQSLSEMTGRGADLQTRIEPLLARSQALLDDSSLDRISVQEIVSNVFAARALVPDSKVADDILNNLDLRLAKRLYDKLDQHRFDDAQEQLSALAIFSSKDKLAVLSDEIEQRRRHYLQQQIEQQQQEKIRQLVVAADRYFAANTLKSFEEVKKKYTEVLLIDKENKDGLRLQAEYQRKLAVHIQQLLSDKRYNDANLWTNQLASETKAMASVVAFRKKITEGRQQQQQKIYYAEKKATEIADLKQAIDDLLLGPEPTIARINQAEDKLSELLSLDSGAYKKSVQEQKLANAYQQLAENLLGDKHYERAIGVVEVALAKLPSASNLLAAREKILKAQQKRRRNITSF